MAFAVAKLALASHIGDWIPEFPGQKKPHGRSSRSLTHAVETGYELSDFYQDDDDWDKVSIASVRSFDSISSVKSYKSTELDYLPASPHLHNTPVKMASNDEWGNGAPGPADDMGDAAARYGGHGGGDGGDGGDRTCNNCGEPGHMRRECPSLPPMVCNFCNEEGHMRRDCPNKPAEVCRNCQQEGHLVSECNNPRKIDYSGVEDVTSDEAWTAMQDAVEERDVFDFKEELRKYMKHHPETTYLDLEEAFRAQDMNVYCIATKREHLLDTMTNMDLQGNLGKEYTVSFRFSPKPERERERETWPKDKEENLERLANAGEPAPTGKPRCTNCKELGHISKNCTADRQEIEKVSIRCYNCDEDGHRVRDCPVPRKDKFACKNCNQPGHKAADCTEPRNADGVECNKCHEMGHFSRDCPQGGSRTCRNCDQEGHIAKECPEPRRMQCRNCDEYGHTGRECPKPQDISRVKCLNCGEMGHKKYNCTNPHVDEDAQGHNASGGGGDLPASNDFGGSGGFDDKASADQGPMWQTATAGGGGNDW
ncbi:hypothetical protein ACHAQF_002486 [Verticillium nonalfalfae]